MDLGIDGRVALVMGASRGIGRAIAETLASERARVALSSRSAEHLKPAAREIAATGAAQPAYFAADSEDPDALTNLVADVERDVGPVEILVVNTGGPPPGAALDQPTSEWERAYRSLVLAPKILIERTLPGMRERGWGRIVNVASTSIREPIPHLALSNIHRAAALGLFKTLAREVAADGVTVNTIATGRFATERLAELAGTSIEEVERASSGDVPAGRLGRPEEYGDLVAFVCSERAAYLTGATIPLDGGLMRSL